MWFALSSGKPHRVEASVPTLPRWPRPIDAHRLDRLFDRFLERLRLRRAPQERHRQSIHHAHGR